MPIQIGSRLKHAWSAFVRNKDPTGYSSGYSYNYRPDRPRFTRGIARDFVTTAVYNRIAIDASSINIRHVRLDKSGRYLEDVEKSKLNECFSLSANIDQTGRAFFQDVVMSMLDEGCVAIVPVTVDDREVWRDHRGISSLRTGKITQWFPSAVRVSLYNDVTGQREEITLPKRYVAIVENPFYAVMNEPNGTMQRLIRKLNLLDSVDEQVSSGKLDLIIQLPYIIKTAARRQQAEERRAEIEKQLAGSKYGIAYTDGTERITQLNRPVENNLLSQVEYLTKMLYDQLGITQEILNGSADDKVMNNYYTQTIEPIMSAIVDEMKRKFLTKTAVTQGQSIEFFRDPFKLIPVSAIAEIADKMTRNEIMSSNEIRQVVGMKPSSDPAADELRNKNLNNPYAGEETQDDSAIDDMFTSIEHSIDEILGDVEDNEATDDVEDEDDE